MNNAICDPYILLFVLKFAVRKKQRFYEIYLYDSFAGIDSVFVSLQEEKKIERSPARVRVTNVSCNSGSTDTYSGTIEEETGAAISFQVPGTIEQLPVHVGQYVKAGQLIASVNPATLQNTYDAAAATLTQARDAYERMKQLHERGSIPEIQWVEAQSKLSQAESSERIAKKNLADCRLVAPYSGVIISRELEIGQSAMPGMPVVKLGKIGNVNVCISVPESELGGISIGTSANIEVPALNAAVFHGKVTEKGITANPMSHTYEVKILVNNTDKRLMPEWLRKSLLKIPTQQVWHLCSPAAASALMRKTILSYGW